MLASSLVLGVLVSFVSQQTPPPLRASGPVVGPTRERRACAGEPAAVPCIPYSMLLPNEAWAGLPEDGPAWDTIVEWSDEPLGAPPDLNFNDASDDMIVLAAALRWKRTGSVAHRNKVEAALQALVGTEDPTIEAWEVARNITGFVVAADIVDYVEPAFFEPWLEGLRALEFGLDHSNPDMHETFAEYQERRPNNQGLACGLARLAIAMYLDHGEQSPENLGEVDDVQAVFHRWLGNTKLPDPGFEFGSCTAWIADLGQKRGINAKDATINGVDVDGVIPADQRRVWDCDNTLPIDPADLGCFPECVDACGTVNFFSQQLRTNYVWEAMQSVVMTAHLLDRCGYRPFGWEDQAIRRASDWLYEPPPGGNGFRPEEACDLATSDPCPPVGPCCPQGADCIDGRMGSTSLESDDTWVPFVTDAYYGQTRADRAHFEDGRPGKVFGFAAWWTRAL